ncbi:MAG: cobalamin B12-binding domain-containing protein [Pseudomonadota bacterium]
MPDQRSIDAPTSETAATRKKTPTRDAVSDGQDVFADLDPGLLGKLEDAALSAERADCRRVVQDALAANYSAETLVDLYVPAVARRLGDQWCADSLGFANVTIAVSRLQSMLRELGLDWSGDVAGNPNAPTVMLIVPQEVYHTLGAMVLGSQLRRLGVSVRMALGMRLDDLAVRLQRSKFHAVFISSSCSEALETLARIVDVVKTSTVQTPPIVIGGSLLDVETIENVTALTGADYATKIPSEALELCGISKVLHSEPQKMRGS